MKRVVCLLVSMSAIASAQAVIVTLPSQSMNAMPIKTEQLRWHPVKNNQIPKNTIVAAENKSGPVYICHAKEFKGTHPGMVTDKGCLITYSGDAILHKEYEVLTGKQDLLEWKGGRSWNYSYYSPQQFFGVEPADSHYSYFDKAVLPVIGGYEYPRIYNADASGVRPVPRAPVLGSVQGAEKPVYAAQPRLLYICRTLSGSSIHVGKIIGNSCNIAIDGKEVSTNYYQTLCLDLSEKS